MEQNPITEPPSKHPLRQPIKLTRANLKKVVHLLLGGRSRTEARNKKKKLAIHPEVYHQLI